MDTTTEPDAAMVELPLGPVPADLWEAISPPTRSISAVTRALLSLAALPTAADLVRAGWLELQRLGSSVEPRFRPRVSAGTVAKLDDLAKLLRSPRSQVARGLLCAWADDLDGGLRAALDLERGWDENARDATERRLAVLREKAEEPGS